MIHAPTLSTCRTSVVLWLGDLKEKYGIDLGVGAHKKVLHEAQEYRDSPNLEEWADVFISLMSSAHAQHWGEAELIQAIEDKVGILRTRTWYQKEDGTYQHTVKPTWD